MTLPYVHSPVLLVGLISDSDTQAKVQAINMSVLTETVGAVWWRIVQSTHRAGYPQVAFICDSTFRDI